MALNVNGKVCVISFLIGLTISLVHVIGFACSCFKYFIQKYYIVFLLGHGLAVNIFSRILFKGPLYQVAVRAVCLGLVFGVGILLTISLTPWTVFGWYLMLLSFFHVSEYLTTAFINPRSLTLDSFLINQSKEYALAAMMSWVEFILEVYFVPEMKQVYWLSGCGLVICLCGEALRKAAMLTARSNFNHVIQNKKEEGHVLVTHGVYNWTRHPSYVGWFWWSIGTQITLCNPICLIGYIGASWKFFRDRILEEEITLLNFFKEEYLAYQKKVGTGLPFIKGYRLEL